MIEGLKPYPQYKDSGQQWLGQIPSTWSLVRTKRKYRLRTEKSSHGHGLELLSIYTHIGVRPRKDLEQKGNKASTTDGYWMVRKGDIIVNKLLAWMGAVGVSHYDGVTSPAYDILRPMDELHSDYYHHLFRTTTYLQQFKSRSRGIMEMRLRLYFDQLGQIPVLAPPMPEQVAIVRFLDYANRRIERYIRAKKKLIALLNEQKQAIIHRAVTRGFDPNVRLKPSGVEGLGDVPEHWEVRRLKTICKLQRGYDLPNDKFIVGEHPVYGSNGIIGYHNSFTTKGPCVTVGRSGSVGEVNYVESDFWAHNTTLFVLDNFGNHWRYIYFLLKSIDLKTVSAGSAVPTLNRNYIHRLYVAVPSLSEQEEVILLIKNNTLELDTAITQAKREIALIREYQTRLVADVVTGQLDVRAAAAQLPEEPEGETELVAESTEDECEPSEFEDIASSGTIG
jgi:type I restriction enzyme, S subunit